MEKKPGEERILLMLLPFWDPQIPPLGISVLKAFLKRHHYPVRAVDFNVRQEFREVYRRYFDTLARLVPESQRLHLYNIGHEVLRNQMTAHLNHTPATEPRYAELVKELVFRTFYSRIDDTGARQLREIMGDFYRYLEVALREEFEIHNPTVLGISVYSGTLAASLFAFKMAKAVNPRTRTVMGGGIFFSDLVEGSPNFDLFMRTYGEFLDRVIVGEGETLFLKFLQEGTRDGQVRVSTAAGQDTLELSRAEPPDFEDFELDYYPHLATYTSRSCPFQCHFCVETIYWGQFRQKGARQIADELAGLNRRWHHQLFVLCDCLLNPVINGLAQELLKRQASFYWDGYLRADPMAGDRETALLWRRAGFYRARLGVESGSPKILELMNKKISRETIKTSIISLALAGIKTSTLWVIGYPGETEADFQLTLDLIDELRDFIYEADCNPFWYFWAGQGKSETWQQENHPVQLYPQWARDLLVIRTWTLDHPPLREETYRRVNRFMRHCRDLGIPNPYSLPEIDRADRRWKKLQKNAVPPLTGFSRGKESIAENLEVNEILQADIIEDSGEWGF